MPAAGALSWAAPILVGALPEILLGLALLLILFASIYMLRKPLTAALGAIPLLGEGAAKWVGEQIDNLVHLVRGWADAAVTPIIAVVFAPIQAIWGFAYATSVGIEWCLGQLGNIATQLERGLGRLGDRIGGLADRLDRGLERLGNLGDQLGNVRNVIIPAAAAAALAAARAFTESQTRAEAQERAQAVAAAKAQATGQVQNERDVRRSEDDRIRDSLAAAAAALTAAIARSATLQREYTDAKTDALTDELTDIRTKAIPKAEARATARADAVAAELTALRLRCIDPLCGVFGNELDLWQQLQTGLAIALVMGLVGEAVRNPEGAAAMVGQAADSLHGMGAAILTPFTGVA